MMQKQLLLIIFVTSCDACFGSAIVSESDSCTSSSKPFRQQVFGSTPAGWIQIGTPKKNLKVVFDTGSDKLVAKTWDTVAHELANIDQGISGMVVPSQELYNHKASSSYKPKTMKSKIHKNTTVGMQAALTYGSGTVVADVGTETAFVGERCLSNQTMLEITADSLKLLHDKRGLSGVLGLQHMKNKSMGHSLFSDLRDAGSMTSFGYCRGPGNNGTFIWGDDSTEGDELDVIGEMHWAVRLGKVAVDKKEHPAHSNKNATKKSFLQGEREVNRHDSQHAGSDTDNDDVDADKAAGDHEDEKRPKPTAADRLKAEIQSIERSIADELKHLTGRDLQHHVDASSVLAKTCPDSKCCAILDTGSNIIAGPSDAINALIKMVDVKPDCSNFDKLPTIALTLGKVPVKIQPHGYIMKVKMPQLPVGWDQKIIDKMKGLKAKNNLVENKTKEEQFGALAEQEASADLEMTKAKWTAVIDDLHREKGIDLRDALAAMLDKPHSSLSSQFLCMPALSPIDKKTAFGALWIVGTPLLDSYYGRWSFAKDADSPKIHLKSLAKTKACNTHEVAAVGKVATKESKAKSKAKKDMTVLMRREPDPKEDESKEDESTTITREPMVRLLSEISYPHWAEHLTQL